jgi:hypothetical protein
MTMSSQVTCTALAVQVRTLIISASRRYYLWHFVLGMPIRRYYLWHFAIAMQGSRSHEFLLFDQGAHCECDGERGGNERKRREASRRLTPLWSHSTRTSATTSSRAMAKPRNCWRASRALHVRSARSPDAWRRQSAACSDEVTELGRRLGIIENPGPAQSPASKVSPQRSRAPIRRRRSSRCYSRR